MLIWPLSLLLTLSPATPSKTAAVYSVLMKNDGCEEVHLAQGLGYWTQVSVQSPHQEAP